MKIDHKVENDAEFYRVIWTRVGPLFPPVRLIPWS